MGGPWWDKKLTVDDGLSLDINKLVRDGLIVNKRAMGLLRWTNTRTREEMASMGFVLEPRGEGLIFRARYTVTRREGDKQDMDYPIELQATRPQYGGRRWWFTCPLVVNGRFCGRRVGKLYLPPRAKYLGCRHCYDLTYQSCQESDKRVNRLVKNREALMAAATSPGIKYALLAFKAFDRIDKLTEREQRRWQKKRRGRPRKMKNAHKKRDYHQEYIRRRRAAVQPAPLVLNPAQLQDAPVLSPSQPPDSPRERIDWTKPYTIEGGRRRNPAHLVQDGLRYDPRSGELVGKAK
jgi:hypothetical protein